MARSERLLVTTVGDEAVIYDQASKVAHALNPLAAAVFALASGQNTIEEIADLAGSQLARPVSVADVEQAVTELSDLDLLEPDQLDDGGLTRRDTLKVFGAVGAGAMLVSSITAPFAMATGGTYVCGSGSTDVENAGGAPLYPQVWTSGGALAPQGSAGGPVSAGAYGLGEPCYVVPPDSGPVKYQWFTGQWHTGMYNGQSYGSGACYDQNNGTVLLNSQVGNQTQCETTGFYVDSSGTWVANAPSDTGVNGQPNNGGNVLCQSGDAFYYNVTEGYCAPNNYICVNGDNVFDGTVGPTGQEPTCPNGDTMVHLAGTGNEGIQGVYQCLPCNASQPSRYRCCEVVCAPSGIGGLTAPQTWSPSAGETTGPGNYAESACTLWGGSFCADYPHAWCTETS